MNLGFILYEYRGEEIESRGEFLEFSGERVESCWDILASGGKRVDYYGQELG